MKDEKKFDETYLGAIAGTLLPVISLLIFWMVRFEGGLIQFLNQYQHTGMLSKVLSLCAIPNLLLFFLFIWTDRSFSARGVIFATLVIALVMLVLKFA